MSLFERVGGSWRSRGGFARGVISVAGGAAAGQVLVVGLAPVLTRIYSPTEFGALAVHVAALSVLAVLSSLRMDAAIPLPSSPRQARILMAFALCAVVAVTGLLVGVSLLGSDEVSSALGLARPEYLWSIVVGTGAVGVYQVFSYAVVRDRNYSVIGRTKVVQGGIGGGAQVALGVLPGAWGLLIGDIAGRSAGTILLARRQTTLRSLGPQGAESVSRTLLQYSKFPLLGAPAAAVNALSLQLPAILLATQYGLAVAGSYALAQRVLGAPMSLVGRAVVQVFHGEGASAAKENPQQFRSLFISTQRRLLRWGAGPVLTASLLAPFAFPIIFGAQWTLAGNLVASLSLMYAAQIVATPLSQTLIILDRQGLQLAWDLARLAATVATFFLADQYGLEAVAAIAMWGAVMASFYVLLVGMCRWQLKKFAGGSSALLSDTSGSGF